MSTQLKLRRGTTAQHSTFTGASGEITIDTTKKTVVVHDGSTAGGVPLAKESDVAGFVSSTSPTLTGNVVVNSNTSSDALRITQTGSGNALVVEDSANPDSTPFVIDNIGNVIVGKTTQFTGGSITPKVEILGAAPLDSSIGLYTFSASSSGPTIEFGQSNNATVGSQTVVASGDSLGVIRFSGSDGTAMIRGAQIVASVDGTPGTNDMPGRLVFGTTADGASSPTERMRINNAGGVTIGSGSASPSGLLMNKSATGSAVVWNIQSVSAAQSDVTAQFKNFVSYNQTAAASFTLSNLVGFMADQGTFGAGSAVTNQIGFEARNGLIGATNNYGFYSNIASGTGRYNFYAAGSADNYFAGNVGIGLASSSGGFKLDLLPAASGAALRIRGDASNSSVIQFTDNFASAEWGSISNTASLMGLNHSSVLRFNTASTERMRIDSAGNVIIGGGSSAGRTVEVVKNITGATSGYGFNQRGQVQSDVTGDAVGFRNVANQAAGFTLPTYIGFAATQGTVSGTITNQIGYAAFDALTGATNNYGFKSDIASGTGRWNFYAAGSADNYFAGRVGIGGFPGTDLDVTGSGSSKQIRAFCTDTAGSNIGAVVAAFGTGASSNLQLRAGNGYTALYSGGASDPLIISTAATERMRIDSAGNVVLKTGSLQEVKTAIAASDISLSTGNYFTKTISGATTFTVSNVPASGTVGAFILELTNGGSATVTWFAGVKWAGGTAPTLTTAGVDIIAFYTHDGGTTWRAAVVSKDSK